MGADLILASLPCPATWTDGDLAARMRSVAERAIERVLRDLDDDGLRELADETVCGFWLSTNDPSDGYAYGDDDVPTIDVPGVLRKVELIYGGDLDRDEAVVQWGDIALLVCGGTSWGDVSENFDTWVLIGALLEGETMPWEEDR